MILLMQLCMVIAILIQENNRENNRIAIVSKKRLASERRRNQLWAAIQCNNFAQADHIITTESHASFLWYDSIGRTLLAQTKNADQLAYLLSVPLNPNLKNKTEIGWTALHQAAFSNAIDKAGQLLAAGADLNIRDGWMRTPLHLAVKEKHTEMVAFLLAVGKK